MLIQVYDALLMAGVVIGILALFHHTGTSWWNAQRDGQALAEAVEARARGADMPLLNRRVFYRGTLPGSLFVALLLDRLVCLIAGSFALEDVVRRAAMVTLVAGGAQYAVTQGRCDRTPLRWPNSFWLCWLVAAVLGLLGSIAEVTSPVPGRDGGA